MLPSLQWLAKPKPADVSISLKDGTPHYFFAKTLQEEYDSFMRKINKDEVINKRPSDCGPWVHEWQTKAAGLVLFNRSSSSYALLANDSPVLSLVKEGIQALAQLGDAANRAFQTKMCIDNFPENDKLADSLKCWNGDDRGPKFQVELNVTQHKFKSTFGQYYYIAKVLQHTRTNPIWECMPIYDWD